MGTRNICCEKQVFHMDIRASVDFFINLLCTQLIWENAECSQCLKEDKAVMSFS